MCQSQDCSLADFYQNKGKVMIGKEENCDHPTQVFVDYIDTSIATVLRELGRLASIKELFKHLPVYSSLVTSKDQDIRDHELEYQNVIKARCFQLEAKQKLLNARNNKLKKDRSVQQGQTEEEMKKEIANGINYATTAIEPIMHKQAEDWKSLNRRKKRQSTPDLKKKWVQRRIPSKIDIRGLNMMLRDPKTGFG